MFGIKHINFDSMTYVLHYKNGVISKEGRGLSFFYFEPNSSIVAIPMGSNDLPFIYNETTNDYQTVSIQGQISYKISDPKSLADVLNFTVKSNGDYEKNEIEKLNQRIINVAQTTTSTYIHNTKLKDALRAGNELEDRILGGLQNSQAIGLLGIEILGVNILSLSATPEMARALETETRERLQQEADQAIYERRNFAVEEKQKQIAEKKMESDVLKSENQRKLREMKLEADISVENQRKKLIEQKTENEKNEADAKGYVLEATLKPYREMDWKMLTALNNNTDPKFNISLAFRELAENADKIGNLNISPELLDSILKAKDERQK